jgi:glutaredoxin 3
MTKNHDITIYSTSWCGYCKMAMKYLSDKGIAYTDKNVETDMEAQAELLKKLDGDFRGVPVIDIDGTLILGFDRPRIDAALAS